MARQATPTTDRPAAAVRAASATKILSDHGDAILGIDLPDGEDLSGGQWQRIAIARALVQVERGADVLILDEPTSAQDVESEIDLTHRLLRFRPGLTTILVSHRMAGVRRAGRIIVLDHGRIVEDGNHTELIRRRGVYAAMYERQAARFRDSAIGATQ